MLTLDTSAETTSVPRLPLTHFLKVEKPTPRSSATWRRESLLVDLHKRVRDVVQGPDGYLYLSLEDRDGGVLRVKPAP